MPPHTFIFFYGKKGTKMPPKKAFKKNNIISYICPNFVTGNSFLGLVNCNTPGAFITVRYDGLHTEMADSFTFETG